LFLKLLILFNFINFCCKNILFFLIFLCGRVMSDISRVSSSASSSSSSFLDEGFIQRGKRKDKGKSLAAIAGRGLQAQAAPSVSPLRGRGRAEPSSSIRMRGAFQRGVGPTSTASSSYGPSSSSSSSGCSSSSGSRGVRKPRGFEASSSSRGSVQGHRIESISQLSDVEIQRRVKDLLNPGKKALTVVEDRNFCAQIKDRSTGFDKAVRLVSNHKVTEYVLNAILSKQDRKASHAWLFKKELFKQMQNEDKTAHNINAFIKQAALHHDFEMAKMAFEAAVGLNRANAVTYNSYIDAAGKNGEFAEAKRAFEEAVVLGLANAVTYASYIDASGKNGEFAEAKRAFEEAVVLGLANAVTYSSYIDVAGKNGEFAEAKRAFEEAVALSLADAVTYASYINAAGKNGEFAEAKRAFEAAVALSRFEKAVVLRLANAVTYNSYIDAAGKNGEFAEAKRAFEAAVVLGLANAVTYASYIDAAGKNGEFTEAKSAFEAAVVLGLANAVTYASYIDAAGKNGEFAEAKRAFEAAVASSRADAVTYNSYIDAAGKSGEFAEAKRAFELAIESRTINKITYMVYLDCLMESSHETEAESLYQSLNWPLQDKRQDGMRMIDLHDYSHGAGYLALKQFIAEPSCPERFGLIPGKGCREDGNHLAFRTYLIEMIQRKLPEWTCQIDPLNAGRILMQKRVWSSGDFSEPVSSSSLLRGAAVQESSHNELASSSVQSAEPQEGATPSSSSSTLSFSFSDPDFLREMEFGADLWKAARQG
jgi:pentatricopeptide repeat protein